MEWTRCVVGVGTQVPLMRYGLELPCGGEDVTAAGLVDVAVAAEQASWDGVFLEDYLVYYRGEDPANFDPWVILASMAARTKRIWLGTILSRSWPGIQ